MAKPSLFRIWIAAARLRTLPLSMAGIVTGNALAISHTDFSWALFAGTLLTAVAFQILYNVVRFHRFCDRNCSLLLMTAQVLYSEIAVNQIENKWLRLKILAFNLHYSIVKDSNADLTVGN